MPVGRSNTCRRSHRRCGAARSCPPTARCSRRAGTSRDWGEAARDLIAAADAAGGEPVAYAHIATGDGETFCVRESGLTAVAVAERFILSSLMIFDMRNALRQLAAAGGGA